MWTQRWMGCSIPRLSSFVILVWQGRWSCSEYHQHHEATERPADTQVAQCWTAFVGFGSRRVQLAEYLVYRPNDSIE